MPSPAAADSSDGYDSKFARDVRSATERYRLVLWARLDGYVQTTDYIAAFGTMYTNHQRFDPKNLSEPTVLIYDTAGRLAACGYQFTHKSALFPALASPDVTGWYDIPKHVHYNIVVDGKMYYAQQPWGSDEQPAASVLIARKLMPANASLKFAAIHPPTHAIVIWAWSPNPNGLFDNAENPSMP